MSRLKRRSFIAAIVFVLLCGTILQVPNGQVQAEEVSFDTIIRNGTILDGSGLPRYEADIGIRNGTIARIGNLDDDTAETDIDAEGLFVTPGFIDLHSHASTSALQEAKSSLTQGVTTELLNVDGGGPTDLNERYALEEEGLGINIGAYIGFNSVWEEVVGHEDRRATQEEIREMQSLISQAMEDGAFGVSAGLFYRPAYYADTDEVIEVVSAAREWRTNFPHHIRNENNEVVEATAETIEIGEKAGLNPHITHMKVMGPDNWGKSVETIGLLEEANARGTYATADVYPYLRSQTGLTAIVPPWVEEGGWEAMLERFADPELRPQIAQEIEQIMHSRVQSAADVYFPTKRRTLADYVEKGFGYDGTGKLLLGFLNFDYDNGATFYIDEIAVTNAEGETAFAYDFSGNDGDAWDPEAFGDELFSYPSNAVNYRIEQNAGRVEIAERQQGNASAYGKVEANMESLENSEALMRFRVEEVGNNQRLRFWLQADEFSSGSSFPVNGYGVELHLGTDQLILYGREDGRSTNFGSVDANMTTDWHWLRVRVQDGELAVRLWKDGVDEPAEWDMVQDIPVPGDDEGEELTPGEATMRLLETEGNLRTIYNFGHEDDLKRIMQFPMTAIASDGGATTSDSVHPRRYGTQPRALGLYVRDKGYLEWEDAIRKMTGLPATIIGMTDRGFIAEGMAADITVFDPETVVDRATFDDPKQYAEGIEYVFVNGELALSEGELTGIQAGQALKRAPNMPSRPMNPSEPIHVEGMGDLLPMDATGTESALQVDYSVGQDPDARKAEGHFRIHDEKLELNFEAESFGKMQVAEGWVSFTGRGTLNGSEERTFLVIIDEHEPLVDDERPTVTVQIEGMDDIRGFLGQADEEPSSVELMRKLIGDFADEGEIADDTTVRQLQTHLAAVERYEKTEKTDKAVKHMEGFKQLLSYLEEREMISGNAATILSHHADQLIAEWR